MTGFQEYPKTLHHPQHTPAIVSKWDEREKRHIPERGQEERYPPVTVHTRDQEEEYAAKGYRDVSSDPAAFEKAVANAIPEGYEFREYPKWVGETLVTSKEHEEALAEAAVLKDEPARKLSRRERVTPTA